MKNQTRYICKMPFQYMEIHDDREFLCCPSWLDVDIRESDNSLKNFHSQKAKDVRESILDGSYKFCDEKQCPYLSELNQGIVSGHFIAKTEENIEKIKKDTNPNVINFAFDRSCNLACPSCRIDFINYKGEQRKKVDVKLEEIENELSPYIKKIYLTGTADPFFSKSFRQFLIDFDHTKFPNIDSIHLHTNGTLWTPQIWDKLKNVHHLIKSCEISIDSSSKETYEKKVRIGGNWDILQRNLEFITQIPTIQIYSFSFVVQDTNFKEMVEFYHLMESHMKNRKAKIKRWNCFYNLITNWGTFSDEGYQIKNPGLKDNPLYAEFIGECKKLKSKKNKTTNFLHLLKDEQSIL